mgnify:FL=1
MEMLKDMQNLPKSNEVNNDEIVIWLQKYENESDSKTKKHYETLVLMAYMPLVNKIAKGLARRSTDPIEDIIQVGAIGLLKAINSYKSNISNNFKTYATYKITGEIKHYLRDKIAMIRPSRAIQELAYRISQIRTSLIANNVENPTDYDIAKVLQMPIEKINDVMEYDRRKNVISLEQISLDNEFARTENILVNREDLIDYKSINENKIEVKEALSQLDKKLQDVVKLTFFEGYSQREIAKLLNSNQMMVSRLLKKALKQLFQILSEKNDDNSNQ